MSSKSHPLGQKECIGRLMGEGGREGNISKVNSVKVDEGETERNKTAKAL